MQMQEVYRAEKFKPRRSVMKQWIVILKEDRGNDCQIELRNMAGYGGENVGEEIEKYVESRVVAPFLLPTGKIGDYFTLGLPQISCALIAGSEMTHHVNVLATDCVMWSEVFGTEDSEWSGCFTISGDAVLVKKREDGFLTTFSRLEALEVATSITTSIENKDWYIPAVQKALQQHTKGKHLLAK